MVELLPYRFAKRHGFLVEPQADGQFLLVAEEGAEFKQLQEVLRVRGEPARIRLESLGSIKKNLPASYHASTMLGAPQPQN